MILVLDPGMAAAIQDLGRLGFKRFGVPAAGALDPLLLACANLLLDNHAEAAGLELPSIGPTLLAAEGPVAVALAGDISADKIAADGTTCAVPAWRAVILAQGERLTIGAPRQGVAYLAVSGGVQSPPMLGSRATYRRAGLGALLEAGDNIPCAAPGALRQGPPWRYEDGPIRVLLGPQDDHFPAASLQALEGGPFKVGASSDRMGLRLSGPVLSHNDKGAEIPTDGVIPGAIQVPGDGQPIVLLADGQTTGGYAKIATVISADLPRLGHARPGDVLRFARVGRDEARKALARRHADLAIWRRHLTAAAGGIDRAALYRANLISGVVAGGDEEGYG
jgi:biotin-dependent carboxylase-like uncharacterized protein